MSFLVFDAMMLGLSLLHPHLVSQPPSRAGNLCLMVDVHRKAMCRSTYPVNLKIRVHAGRGPQAR